MKRACCLAPFPGERLTCPGDLIFYIEAENQILIAQVKLPVGHDRMRPESARSGTNSCFPCRKRRSGRSSFPAGRRRLDEHAHRPFAFAITDEMSIGIGQRSTLSSLPEFQATFPVLPQSMTGPAAPLSANNHKGNRRPARDATVVVGHILVESKLWSAWKLAAIAFELHVVTADPVASTGYRQRNRRDRWGSGCDSRFEKPRQDAARAIYRCRRPRPRSGVCVLQCPGCIGGRRLAPLLTMIEE